MKTTPLGYSLASPSTDSPRPPRGCGRARRLGHYSPVGVGIWSLLAAIWPSLPQSFLTTNTCVIHTDRVETDCYPHL